MTTQSYLEEVMRQYLLPLYERYSHPTIAQTIDRLYRALVFKEKDKDCGRDLAQVAEFIDSLQYALFHLHRELDAEGWLDPDKE